MLTRTEHIVSRFGTVVTTALFTWLWILASGVLFFLVAAVASATDLRMLNLHEGPRALLRDLGHGVRMFFRILRDPRAPYRARAILALAFVYWLLPADAIGDGRQAVGMLDDLLVAVFAAKLFVYLCPDDAVAAHAAVVCAEA